MLKQNNHPSEELSSSVDPLMEKEGKEAPGADYRDLISPTLFPSPWQPLEGLAEAQGAGGKRAQRHGMGAAASPQTSPISILPVGCGVRLV